MWWWHATTKLIIIFFFNLVCTSPNSQPQMSLSLAQVLSWSEKNENTAASLWTTQWCFFFFVWTLSPFLLRKALLCHKKLWVITIIIFCGQGEPVTDALFDIYWKGQTLKHTNTKWVHSQGAAGGHDSRTDAHLQRVFILGGGRWIQMAKIDLKWIYWRTWSQNKNL